MKYLKEPKICNGCKTEHDEVPDNAKRDKDFHGWHFECKNNCDLKSTMFVRDDMLDPMHCKCDDCRDDINAEECEYDCRCQGCHMRRVDNEDYARDCYLDK